MPLHLLGKKSWNPYSPAAIARVQADEAAFQELEQDYAERQAAYESQRQLAALRGLAFDARPPTPPPARVDARQSGHEPEHDARRERSEKAQRAKRRGEDDTDRDIRLARADAEGCEAQPQASSRPPRSSDAHVRITDHAGHIQLFAQPRTARPDKQQRAQQRLQEQAQGGMRFKHAAGYQADIKERPWYSSGVEELDSNLAQRILDDAHAQKDPAWQAREQQRVASADPMADMMRGIGQMKQVQAERERLNRERELDLAELRAEQERQSRREERLRAARHDGGGRRAAHRRSRRERSRSESPRRRRSKSPRQHRSKSPRRHRSKSPRRHRDQGRDRHNSDSGRRRDHHDERSRRTHSNKSHDHT